jgi:hypothetical protein
MTTGTRNAEDRTTIVAPRERTPPVARYLAMMTSMDPVLGKIDRWSVDQLLDLAQTRAGGVPLRNGGSNLQFEGLRHLAEPIQHDGYYDDIGRRAANHYIYGWISKYIQFERDLATFPGIPDVPVPNPIFVIGFGRTGSTFMHNLLALDPEARAPLLWELMEPSPPPRPETYESDPRIRRVRMQLESRKVMMPDLEKIHESGVLAPEECNHMMRHGEYHIARGLRSTPYAQWLHNLGSPELYELYKHYKLQVQHLQLFHRKGHWACKCISHAHFFPVLFKVFPDARVIRLHRDPSQIVPAFASIVAHLQVIYTSRINFQELGQHSLDYFLDSMRRSMEIDREVGGEHFIDVLFDDLTRNPVGTLRQIYSKFGYDFTPQFERRLREFLQSEPVTRNYKHVYSFEQFGLSRAQILARSSDYLEWVERKTGSKLYDR